MFDIGLSKSSSRRRRADRHRPRAAAEDRAHAQPSLSAAARYVSEVKSDISREMELDELRRLKTDVESAARDIEQSVATAQADLNAGARSVEQQLSSVAASESSIAPPAEPLTEPPSTQAPPVPVLDPLAAKPAAESPRQPSLPGFDRQ
jgi:sec-independent protein translocase protein TatB